MPKALDIEALRYPGGPSRQGRTSQPRRRVHAQRFIRGPLSLDWVGRAAGLPGQALHVAIWLLYLSGLHGSQSVKLAGAGAFGVTRWAAQRGLKQLEHSGLVEVERHPGRKSRVTLLGAEVSR